MIASFEQINFQISGKKIEGSLKEFLINYENDIQMLFNAFKSEEKWFKCEESIILTNFSIEYTNDIKNKDDFFLFAFTIFIVMSLTFKTSIKEQKYDENDHEFLKKNKYESNQLMNSTLIGYRKFLIWIEICTNINTINKIHIKENKDTIRKNIMKAHEILHSINYLKKEKIWIKKKCLIFLLPLKELKQFVFLEFFNYNLNIYEKSKHNVYLYGRNFFEIFELFKPNIFSNQVFEINADSNFIKNCTLIKAKIDYELLEYFFNKKINKTQYNAEFIDMSYNELIEKMKLAIKDKKYLVIKEISKNLAELSYLIRIKKILEKKKNSYFYFPTSICFRGRTYFSSSVSFTLFKEIRYCLYDENYEENFIKPFHPLNIKIDNQLQKHLPLLKKITKYDYSDKSEEIQISLIWLLISLAENNKKTLGKSVKINEFIEHGIKILNEEIVLNDIDEFDDLKIVSLLKIFEEISKNIYIKRFISKDATASCFQHLVKTLGPKNENALKWCNLKSQDTWYDTYSYLLEHWKEKKILNKPEDENFLNYYFTRKTIKKTTMTVQYGAGLKTCIGYSLKEANLEKKSKEGEKFIYYIKDFYKHISEDIGLLEEPSLAILTYLSDAHYIIETTEYDKTKAKIFLAYRNVKYQQLSTIWKKKRLTKNKLKLSNTINYEKVNTSARANYIHVQDSAIVRHVISQVPIIPIHDCFLIDYRSTTFLISLINDAMQKEHHRLLHNNKFDPKEIFSIFIVI